METQAPADQAKLLRQQETLRTIIESISSELELRPLLTRIVQHACELLHADRGTIGLVDSERNLIRTEAVYKMPPEELGAEMRPGVGLAGKVLETQETVILNQYGTLDNPMHADLTADAVIGLPIFWHGRMIGFFGIGAEPPKVFDEQDVEMLTLLARHAAIAIENARLYETAKRRAARHATLSRIGKLIAGSLDLNELLQTAVAAIREHLHFADAGVLLVDEDDPEMLNMVARSGIYTTLLPENYRQSIDQGIIGAAARSRQVVHTTDAMNDPRYLRIEGADDIRSVIGVPIIVNERLLGVLNVESPDILQEEDAALLELVADQLGVAIANARLFAAEKRRAARQATLNRLGQIIAASLDLNELLQTAVAAIDEYLSYSNTAVLLVDPNDPDTLVLTARSGLYAKNVKGEYRQNIHDGIIGAAARSREPVLIKDVHQDPDYLPIPGAEDIRSELAFPLVNQGQLQGVINLESTRPLNEDEAADLKIMADQLSVAIANARLFDQTQQALAETRLLYKTSRRISSAMDVDDVIQAYLQQVAVRGRYVCSVVLYEFNEDKQRTGVIVRGRWSPDEGLVLIHERYPYNYDDLDPILDAGQTVTISDVFSDARASQELRQIQAENGRPALAMIPLMANKNRFGLVILSYPDVCEWTDSDLWQYQVTAAQLATAIHTRRQQRLLYQSGQELAVLRERQRLARELHDSVTQLIFSTTLIAQSIGPAWQRDPEEGQKRVERLLELSQHALSEMRALLFELRSPEAVPADAGLGATTPDIARLSQVGLIKALENHFADVAKEGPTVQFDAPTYRPMPLDHEVALFRIAQEALNNVVKHAQADQVAVELVVENGITTLLVRDNGVGFDAETDSSGFGMRTMQERAQALNGRVQVQSRPGQGTIVQAQLPRTENES